MWLAWCMHHAHPCVSASRRKAFRFRQQRELFPVAAKILTRQTDRRSQMYTILIPRTSIVIIAVSLAVIMSACGRSASLQEGTEAASEPTAAWAAAFNAGDPTTLAALYAEDARSLPPGGPP